MRLGLGTILLLRFEVKAYSKDQILSSLKAWLVDEIFDPRNAGHLTIAEWIKT
jgi:hypothetical protein